MNDEGLKLDRQSDTSPVWGTSRRSGGVLDHVAERAGCHRADILGVELVAFDTAPPAIFGPEREFFASGRLDNLSSVHAGLTALIGQRDSSLITVLAAFDHEEVGSGSRSGASGPALADLLQRVTAGLGGDFEAHCQALAGSVCVSADTGHAVHPNYVGRHDPINRPLLNAGPLLKINANQRYATNAVGAALWRRACRAAGVATQEFVSHNSVPCGSTIGPLTATRLGVATVDVGAPLLSMHSARELAGTGDVGDLAAAMASFLATEL